MPARRDGSAGLRRLFEGLARVIVIAVLTATLLLAVVIRWLPLDSWWIELLRYVPYPVFLVPAALTVVMSWSLSRRWRWAAAAALGLVLTAIMGLAVGIPDPSGDGARRVRVMAYNIKAYLAEKQPGNFEALAREVAQQAPDVLVLEDAMDEDGPSRNLREVVPTIFDGRYVYAQEEYFVISRFPLRDCRPGRIWVPGHPQDYVRCTVMAGDRPFDLITVHLLSPRRGLNATRHERADGIDDWQENFADRLDQALLLADDIAVRQRLLVVAGDLNAAETSPVVRTLLARGLRDAYSSAGFGYGYTHGHSLRLGFSFLRIDHILVSPEIGVSRSFAGGREASEHRPVIADLWLRPAPH